VIGNGVVLDLFQLFAEIRELEEKGIDAEGRILISGKTHLVMPYHKLVEAANEKARGKRAIDTSKRGIGPAYMDKVGRCGVQLADIFEDDVLREKIAFNLEAKRHIFELLADDQRPEVDFTYAAIEKVRHRVGPMVTDVSRYLNDAVATGKRILFEGAQGTLLDIDFGTYPFITSSNATIGGILTGLGVSPRILDRITGIVKAYQTRVGAGPFPTELNNPVGQGLRDRGQEYGATTGRPRRCGWLDLPLLRYSVQINGVDDLAIMKLDVLDDLDEINVCVGYRLDGEHIDSPPQASALFERLEPVYETLPGWDRPTHGVRDFAELHPNAVAYLKFIEDFVGAQVSIISTSADRDDTIVLS
jgi:adenylosuccinate synthase